MSRVYWSVMTCVCWALFVATAPCCLGSEDEAAKLNAVRKATADFFDSANQGDEKKFKARTFVREGEEELSKAGFGFMVSLIGIRKAIIDRFGEGGLDAAKKNPGRGIEFLVPPEGREWVKELEFEHWSNAYEKGAAECSKEGSTIPKVVDAVFAELMK